MKERDPEEVERERVPLGRVALTIQLVFTIYSILKF
jgi:hypothetical protein